MTSPSDPSARALALAAEARQREIDKRAANRAAFGAIAEFVDEHERYFGKGFKVRYLVNEATGETRGRPGPRGVPISVRPRRGKR